MDYPLLVRKMDFLPFLVSAATGSFIAARSIKLTQKIRNGIRQSAKLLRNWKVFKKNLS
jgi:hypothetical protein